MGLRLGPLTLPWPKADGGDDPYWDFFLHTPPSDRRNFVPDLIRFWPAERRYELIEVKGPGDR